MTTEALVPAAAEPAVVTGGGGDQGNPMTTQKHAATVGASPVARCDGPRRQLVLWSAALLFLTLTGVDLEVADVSRLQGAWSGIQLFRNPPMIPACMALVVMYFCFRLFIEWHLVPSDVRRERLHAADFHVAVSIASLSFITFIAVGFGVNWRSLPFIPAVTYIACLALIAIILFVAFPLLVAAYHLASSWVSCWLVVPQRAARPAAVVARIHRSAAVVSILAAMGAMWQSSSQFWEPLVDQQRRVATMEIEYLVNELESTIFDDQEPPSRVIDLYQQITDRWELVDIDTTARGEMIILDRLRELSWDSPPLTALMAGDSDASIRGIAAASPTVGADALARLAEDPAPIVQSAHPETRSDVLASLAENDNISVRENVASNSGTPANVLAGLAADGEASVRRNVAINRNTSVASLTTLATDHEVRVRDAVAFHPATPADILSGLATDVSSLVRERIAGRADTPQDTLEALSVDSSVEVRGALAYNRSAPATAVARLAQDDFFGTRRGVAFNPNTPTDVLVQLSGDPNDVVREAATRNLNRRLDE